MNWVSFIGAISGLVIAITGLVTAIHAHGRIDNIQQEKTNVTNRST